MLRKITVLLILTCCASLKAQVVTQTQYEAVPVGGKEELEQVLQTQLSLPKPLLTSNFAVEVAAMFDLDSLGHATNIRYNKGINNALRNETTRVLHFMKFKRTQNDAYLTYPYYFAFPISTERYYSFIKQRYKLSLKKPLEADSSYVIHSKADKSPEYYKNGDEGLSDFVLSQIEYPKLAIEKSVEGTVVVDFVVETNGYVTGVTVRQGLGAGCTDEAVRLVKITRWIPAVMDNKYVRYRMSYPITFSLRNISRDASSTIGQ